MPLLVVIQHNSSGTSFPEVEHIPHHYVEVVSTRVTLCGCLVQVSVSGRAAYMPLDYTLQSRRWANMPPLSGSLPSSESKRVRVCVIVAWVVPPKEASVVVRAGKLLPSGTGFRRKRFDFWDTDGCQKQNSMIDVCSYPRFAAAAGVVRLGMERFSGGSGEVPERLWIH